MASVVKIVASLIKLGLVIVGSIIGGPVGAFIGAIIGSLIEAALVGLVTKKPSSDTQIANVNVRLVEPIRWIAAGKTRVGGAVIFADFDAAGNLWYIVVHCDSQLVAIDQILLDENLVTLDGSGNVTNKDFRLNSKFEPVTTDGAGNPYCQLWTTTYDASDPTPPGVSALIAAGVGWTADHKLVGTTYTVVRMAALKAEHRYKIYKWRGQLQLGEPNVAIIGDWSVAHDPREEGQIAADATTHTFTRNAVLVWAWFRTHRYGLNKSVDSINWGQVAIEASKCDDVITGIDGDYPRYTCDLRAPEDRERGEVQTEILACMDAVLVYDDEGKCWPRVGKYEAPTLALRRNRDIIGMESAEANNGESETQGVVIRYSDPAAAYSIQPAAAWINPNYYVEGQAASFLSIEIPAITNHNQAMRIAKAIGLRLQPPHKLAPTTGLRGLRARHERIVDLQYDNTFTGQYEICTQVELDPAGVLVRFGAVPIDEDRWTLLAGEEKPKPVIDDALADGEIDAPTLDSAVFSGNRLRIGFDAPPRSDVNYQAEYIVADDIASQQWLPMTVDMTANQAATPLVIDGQEYVYRYRAVGVSGKVSDWQESEPLAAPMNITPASDLSASVAGSEVTLEWRNPVNPNFESVDLYRGTTTTFGSATLITNVPGASGAAATYDDTGRTPGTYYYWVVATALDGNTATETGPTSATVTL